MLVLLPATIVAMEHAGENAPIVAIQVVQAHAIKLVEENVGLFAGMLVFPPVEELAVWVVMTCLINNLLILN